MTKAYIAFGGKDVVATTTDHDRVVEMDEGPTYPDLLDRLIQRADERHGGVLKISLEPGDCRVQFGRWTDEAHPRVGLGATFESAALAALATGEKTDE